MIRALRSEWIKMRTLAMNWVLTIVAIVFPLVITLITALVRGKDAEFDMRNLLDVLTGTSRVSVLLLMVVAAVTITNEYAYGTIRPTFAAMPKRGHVMAAKAVLVVIYAMVVQALVVLVGVGAGAAIARSKGATMELSSVPTATPALVGAVLLAGLSALLGLGVGMLLRSTPLSVTLLIIWPLIVETLIGGLLVLITKNEHLLDWLPFRAGFQMSTIDTIGILGGPSRLVGGIYFGLVALGVALLGALTVQRRDA
ncbi:MAG: ABC transporter permease [Actinomycetota bacterium]